MTTNEKTKNKLALKPRFEGVKNAPENLKIFQMIEKIKMDKSIYIGETILNLSKIY